MVLTCNCRGLTDGLMDVKLVFADVDSLVIDVDGDLLMKHYIQFVLGSEHADWMVEILEFDGVMQMWMICILVFLSLLEWKPLVKMKMVGDLSLGIKMWDTLFYLPRESDVGASWFYSVTNLEFMGGGSKSLGLGFRVQKFGVCCKSRN